MKPAMRRRRTTVAGLGLLMLAAGCDRVDSAARAPAPPAVEPAAGEDPVPDPAATPTPAVVEPLALRFVTPNIGPPGGGNEVIIDGRGFDAYPRVAFGGVQAWIRSVTATEITVTVPPPERAPAAGEARVVDVRVTNPPVGSEGPVSETLVRAYSYLAPEGEPAGDETTGDDAPAGDEVPDRADLKPKPAQDATLPAGEAPGEPPAAATAPTLVAGFTVETVTGAEGCPPPSTAVRFTDRSTGAVSAWFWEFGDGSTSEERHPEHCYRVPGMRSVSLTVSGGGASATASAIVIAGME
jgi:PKD domain/IPT/TIG domain